MTQIIAILVLTDIILAVLKTFGLIEPITWMSIYWGFLALSLLAFGIEDE